MAEDAVARNGIQLFSVSSKLFAFQINGCESVLLLHEARVWRVLFYLNLLKDNTISVGFT